MKKIFFFLSAIALLGMATACVDQQPVNPNFNAERGEVKTDFMINIATPVTTKATVANVQGQATPVFLGMQNMTLFVLKGDPAATGTAAAADFESTKYNLGTLGTSEISTTQSSKIYNLTFPTGVTNMVFYGKATEGAAAAKGKISWPTDATNKAGVKFGLTPIATATTDFDGEATKIAAVLNAVVAAFGDVTAQGYDANLKKAYDIFTTIGTNELRLGSAPAVKRMLTDLQKTMNNLKTDAAIATTCNAILTAIGTPGTINGVQANFPADLGLPEGAAQLTFGVNPNADQTGAKKNEFYYVTTHGAVDNTTATPITKYTYPVELCYWVSSPIRVSEDPDITADMYPITVATWDSWTSTATGWADKWVPDGTITSATRAVALTKNIQYANALMKTTIAYENGVTKLQDNNAAIHTGEENNEIDVTNTAFTVKGVLVGKQPTQVGWNFKDETTTARDNVVYDTQFDATAIPTGNNPLYTMVFDNYTTSTAANDKVVNIAIEMVNNTGKDFWGKDNLIPAGGTFYLAAQLDLATLKTVPQGVESVFVQDFMTTVNLTIGATSLQSAYATVPDLRSVAMTFGLSVDLAWQTGATFDITLGGQTTTTGTTGN